MKAPASPARAAKLALDLSAPVSASVSIVSWIMPENMGLFGSDQIVSGTSGFCRDPLEDIVLERVQAIRNVLPHTSRYIVGLPNIHDRIRDPIANPVETIG